jgi:nitrite reductase/ring-hydroxylating ferredoxin subunit/DMSO/TMAO reductase YedYZ heme-binding membrane subunit
MSLTYRAIGWNRQKKIYDLVLASCVAGYLALFVGAGWWARPNLTIETLLIRALGTASFLLLHVILSIGPLCRLDSRFLPLLYNRRHLGVTMFLLALGHGVFALVQFHGLGDLNPLVSLLVSNTRWSSLAQFPFQQLGFAALLILLLMAVTSHDFWLHNLTPAVWKRLHMGVYVAYGLLVGHVSLGVLQSERSPILAGMVGFGLVVVFGLHLAASRRERRLDLQQHSRDREGFVEVCPVDSIPNNRARVLSVAGERVAVFRHDGRISALSNVCAHQNGPLGEGKIIDGCVTCPWHGYQYLPESGASPPPFHEKVPTFRVKVVDGMVLVHPRAYPLGTPQEPVRVTAKAVEASDEFYIGYEPRAPRQLGRHIRRVVVGLGFAGLMVCLVLLSSQDPLSPSFFEFDTSREFTGIVEETPLPGLRVSRPNTQAYSRYLLVSPGKHGAAEVLRGLHGFQTQLRGKLIYREGLTMIEMDPESLRADRSVAPAAADTPEDLGIRTLRGEIVDSKCYLGVMNPGRGKVHRDCAVRCLSGGVPPALLVQHPSGQTSVLLLESDGSAILEPLLRFAGESVAVRGRLLRSGEALRLQTTAGDIQILEAPSEGSITKREHEETIKQAS